MTDEILGALPEGLGMALAQNVYAMQHFSSLPDEQQRAVVARARAVESQNEMQALVDGLIRH